MFGIRPDGKIIRKIDPIVKMTPIIMPKRYDAQVFVKHSVDLEKINQYIKEQRQKGNRISHMNIIVAAFVRTLFFTPELNRFIMNKKFYQRNEICVSYVILKEKTSDGNFETTIKVKFEPTDTIFEVAKKMETEVKNNIKGQTKNQTDKIAEFIIKIPLVPNTVFSILKLLDRYGLLPKAVLNASPFHTSMFITNLAFIRMNYAYHHIYNFGTTSVFFSMGKKEHVLDIDKENNIIKKEIMPLGIAIDERICPGALYAKGMSVMSKFLNNPSLLEETPKKNI